MSAHGERCFVPRLFAAVILNARKQKETDTLQPVVFFSISDTFICVTLNKATPGPILWLTAVIYKSTEIRMCSGHAKC